MSMKKNLGITTAILVGMIVILLSFLGGKISTILSPPDLKVFALSPVKELPFREISKQDFINEISDEQITAVAVFRQKKDLKYDLEYLEFKFDHVPNTKIYEEVFKLSSLDLLTQMVTGSGNANASNYPPQCPHSYECRTIMIGGDTRHGCKCI